MNIQGRSIIGRRGIILLLAVAAVGAGLLWWTMLNGVGTASAYGGPNNGAVGNGVILDQHEQPPIIACRLPPEPCG